MAKVNPRSLVVKGARGHDLIQSASQHKFLINAVVNALIKGLIVGLSNDDSYTESELIFEIISRLVVVIALLEKQLNSMYKEMMVMRVRC